MRCASCESACAHAPVMPTTWLESWRILTISNLCSGKTCDQQAGQAQYAAGLCVACVACVRVVWLVPLECCGLTEGSGE